MSTSPSAAVTPAPRDPSRVESNRWLVMLREGQYDKAFGDAAPRLKRALDIAERIADQQERAHMLLTLGMAVVSESVKRSACTERDELKADMQAGRPEMLELRRYQAAMRHAARELEKKVDAVLERVRPLRDGSHMDHLHWLAHEMFVFTNYAHAGLNDVLRKRIAHDAAPPAASSQEQAAPEGAQK